MPKTPNISVVMPVYNRAARVATAIDSILNQRHEDFEFIIVDDGSTDNTAQVLAKYAALDSRIRCLQLPVNSGQGLARAVGNNAALGEYIAIMDSDDEALPDRLEKQKNTMDENPKITLSGGCAFKFIRDERQHFKVPLEDGKIKSRLVLVDSSFIHSTVMMRRQFLIDNNVNYSAERRGDDDYEFFNRLVAAGAKFTNIPDVISSYYRHGDNITNTIKNFEKNKHPLRQYLLSLYYPDLTIRETSALATMMTAGQKLNLKDCYAGIIACEKAMPMSQSQYGEDRDDLNVIIGHYFEAVKSAIKGRI